MISATGSAKRTPKSPFFVKFGSVSFKTRHLFLYCYRRSVKKSLLKGVFLMKNELKDVDKLKLLDIETTVLKEKTTSKARYSVNEKVYFKNSITEIAESLAVILSDDTLDAEFKERLESETRNQMKLINKAIDDLERLIRISRNILED